MSEIYKTVCKNTACYWRQLSENLSTEMVENSESLSWWTGRDKEYEIVLCIVVYKGNFW